MPVVNTTFLPRMLKPGEEGGCTYPINFIRRWWRPGGGRAGGEGGECSREMCYPTASGMPWFLLKSPVEHTGFLNGPWSTASLCP